VPDVSFLEMLALVPQGFVAAIAKEVLGVLKLAVDFPLVSPLQQKYVAYPSSRMLHYCAYLAIFVVASPQVGLAIQAVVDREGDEMTAHSDSVDPEDEAVVVVGCPAQLHPVAEK